MAGQYRGTDDYATIDRSSAETYARMRKHRHGRAKHIILGILGVILGVVLVEAIGLAWTGYHMYGDLKAVKSETSILEESIKNGDAEATQTALDEVQSGVHGINDGLHSVPWQVAAHFPGVGSDIRIAQQLGETGTGLVDDALVPFVGAIKGTSLATLFADGKIDAEGVQRISDAYATVAPVVRTGIDDLNAIPEGENTKLKQVEDKVKAPLQKATEMLDFADAVLPYAPQMVGAGGQTRTYLLVAQNNSELRATGGFPGSWIPVTVRMRSGRSSARVWRSRLATSTARPISRAPACFSLWPGRPTPARTSMASSRWTRCSSRTFLSSRGASRRRTARWSTAPMRRRSC